MRLAFVKDGKRNKNFHWIVSDSRFMRSEPLQEKGFFMHGPSPGRFSVIRMYDVMPQLCTEPDALIDACYAIVFKLFNNQTERFVRYRGIFIHIYFCPVFV